MTDPGTGPILPPVGGGPLNILILSCSRDVSLVKAFRRALINDGGGAVIAGDVSPQAAALYFADDGVLLPPSADPRFPPALLELCRDRKVHLVLSARDADLPVLAAAAAPLAAAGTRALVAGVEALRTCQDKRLFADFCRRRGFPAPHTYAPGQAVRFPVFVKPARGAGSRQARRANDERELELARLDAGGEALVQEYLDWPEFTLDLFADFSGRVLSVVPRERLRTVGGESYIGRTVRHLPAMQLAVDLAGQLGLVGPNTIQCFCREDEVRLIEVNPRFGGGANLGFAAGADSPQMLVSLLRGKAPDPLPGFREGLVMLRYTQDLFLAPAAGAEPLLEPLARQESGRIYCIDVDGTVCTEGVEYENVQPIAKSIRRINELYDRGNTIILYTARGAYSGVDWSGLTESQLRAWGVRYHRFLIGKPFADVYVDNKALHVLDWV